MFKITISLLIIFLSWFLPTALYTINESPCFIIVFYLIIIFLTINIFTIIKNYHLSDDYLFALFSNYLCLHGYIIFNFVFNNLLPAFVFLVASFLFTIFLYQTSSKINKIASYYLLPYLLWQSTLVIIYLIKWF